MGGVYVGWYSFGCISTVSSRHRKLVDFYKFNLEILKMHVVGMVILMLYVLHKIDPPDPFEEDF